LEMQTVWYFTASKALPVIRNTVTCRMLPWPCDLDNEPPVKRLQGQATPDRFVWPRKNLGNPRTVHDHSKFRGRTLDKDQPDQHMEEREAEKTADLEALADAITAFRQLHRELDQWERVHLARGLAAVFSGCYGAGASEAALALTPEVERSPRATLPTDPFYQRLDLTIFERALNEMWAEPARRFPHFGPIEVP
jgi:hypothetical protein